MLYSFIVSPYLSQQQQQHQPFPFCFFLFAQPSHRANYVTLFVVDTEMFLLMAHYIINVDVMCLKMHSVCDASSQPWLRVERYGTCLADDCISPQSADVIDHTPLDFTCVCWNLNSTELVAISGWCDRKVNIGHAL